MRANNRNGIGGSANEYGLGDILKNVSGAPGLSAFA
jgi:hypothetical protein